MGAIDLITKQGERIREVKAAEAKRVLVDFETELASDAPSMRGSRYLLAASRQTDNVAPRRTRIEVLSEVLEDALA